MTNRRRGTRVPYSMQAVVSWGRHSVPGRVDDVSARGMFMRTDLPPPGRQLVKVKFQEVPGGGSLSLHAMVIHSNDGSSDKPAGAGLELYANTQDKIRRWTAVVNDARDRATQSLDVSDAEKASRRGFERFSAILEVRFKSSEALVKMYSKNISQGGMFIQTPLDVPLGSEVLLDVIHPETEHVMHLMAIVVRKTTRDSSRGIAVEFTDLDDQRREAFLQFANRTIDLDAI